MQAVVADLNRSRRLGVEHEFAFPSLSATATPQHVQDVQNVIADILSRNGLPSIAREHPHVPVPSPYLFAVERDSSISGEERYEGIRWIPVEVKSRILTGYDEWEQYVPRMLDICSYLGGRATRSCGYHIHLSLPEFTDNPTVARSLFNLFHRFEPVIYRLQPPSRSNNNFCLPLPNLPGLLNGCATHASLGTALVQTGNRYSGLNLTHLFDAAGPRLELRFAASTLDCEKARHWLRFCLQLVEHASNHLCQAGDRVAPTRKGLARLFTACGLKVNSRIYPSVSPECRETAQFLLKRWRSFDAGTAPHVDMSSVGKVIGGRAE